MAEMTPEQAKLLAQQMMALSQTEAARLKQAKERLALEQETWKIERERIEKYSSHLTNRQKEALIQEKERDLEVEQLRITEQELNIDGKRLVILEKELGLSAGLTAALKAQLKDREKELALQKKIREAEEEQLEIIEQIRSQTGSLITALTGVDDAWKTTLVGAIARSNNLGTALSVIGQQLSEQLSLSNMLGSMYMKMTESTIKMVAAFDSATTGFRKATSAGEEYDDMIMDSWTANKDFGMSIEEVSKAMTELYTNIRGFNTLQKETQEGLVETVGVLEQLGVSGAESSETMNTLIHSFGMSAEQAAQTTANIAGLGKEIGIPANTLVSEYKSALPTLAAFGKRGEEVFKRLGATAAKTGVQISKMMDFGKQFETFDDAAERVARINMMLGGPYMDTLKMMGATTDEQFDLTISAIGRSGRAFEDMTIQQRRYFADALGVDLPMAAAMSKAALSGNRQELERLQLESKGFTGSIEEMREQAKANATVQEKWNELMNSFAIIIKPIVATLHAIVDVLLAIDRTLGGYFIPSLFAALLLLKLFNKTTMISNGLLKIKTFLFGEASKAQRANNQVSAAGARSMLVTAAAVAIAAVGIAALIAAVAALAANMKGMGSEAWALVAVVGIIIVGMIALVATMLALAPAAASAGVAFLPLGAAIFLIGAGIALVVLAISAVINSVTGLVKVLLEGSESLKGLGADVALFGLALMLILPGGIMAGIGLMALSVGFLALAASLMLIKTDDLKALGDMFLGLGKIAESVGTEAFGNLAESIDNVLGKLKEYDAADIKKFNSFMTVLYAVAPGAAAAATAAIPAGGAGRLAAAGTTRGQIAAAPAAATAAGITGPGAGRSAPPAANKEAIFVTLKLDEDILGKGIARYQQDEFQKPGR